MLSLFLDTSKNRSRKPLGSNLARTWHQVGPNLASKSGPTFRKNESVVDFSIVSFAQFLCKFELLAAFLDAGPEP